MAKKGFGKFVAFAAISGAVAAGVSYVLQYKIYHKELDKDFREFEEDEEDEDASQSDSFDPRKINRNYISLNSSRDEFKMAAKDMASATKNVLKDAGNLFSDTAHEAVSAAVDTAHIAIHSMKAKKDDNIKNDTDVDGSIISEVSKGKDGVKVKLADRMKALQWLSDHMDLATDKQKAEIALLKAKVQTDDEEETADDGFLEALQGSAAEDWMDEEN